MFSSPAPCYTFICFNFPHFHYVSSLARSAAFATSVAIHAATARSLYVTDIVMYRPFSVAMFGILSTVCDFVEYRRVDRLAPSTRRALGMFVAFHLCTASHTLLSRLLKEAKRRLTHPSLERLLYTVYPPPPYPVHYPADPSRRLRRPHPGLPADGREPILYCHREHRRGALGAVVIARVHVPAAHGSLRSTGSRYINL